MTNIAPASFIKVQPASSGGVLVAAWQNAQAQTAAVQKFIDINKQLESYNQRSTQLSSTEQGDYTKLAMSARDAYTLMFRGRQQELQEQGKPSDAASTRLSLENDKSISPSIITMLTALEEAGLIDPQTAQDPSYLER